MVLIIIKFMNNHLSVENKSIVSFEQIVSEFVRTNKPKLYILTPCYGSQVFVNYVQCLMVTKELFQRFNIPLAVEFCRNDSLVSRARNNLVAKAMNDSATTHILFIDADITWDPIDVIKLMLTNKAVVGGVYPLKHYNWSKLVKDSKNPHVENVVKHWIDKKNNSQFSSMITDENMIQHNLLKYNMNFIDTYLNIEANLAKVKHIATGFMMFKREVIEQMSKAFPQTKYVDDVGFLKGSENDYAFALFDCGVEEGHYFSEDWYFCHRWTKMGGSIYVDVGINLMHTGIEDYKGCFIASVF
jgi:hypothetical protein